MSDPACIVAMQQVAHLRHDWTVASMPTTGGRFGHARVAVMSVIEEETQAVHQAFRFTERIAGKPYFTVSGCDLARPVLLSREIGRNNVQSGERIRDIIEHWRPEALILCGIAGGIAEHEDIKPGDIVIPDYVHYCSFAKLSANGQQFRYMAYDHPSLSLHENYAAPLRDDSSWLTDDVRQLLPSGRSPRVFIGGLVAGDKVFGDPTSEEQQKVLSNFDDAIAIDMESVGLCRAVAASRVDPQYNPRLLIVRAISDLVGDPNNNTSRADFKAASCAVAAAFAYRIASDILEHEPDPRPAKGGPNG